VPSRVIFIEIDLMRTQGSEAFRPQVTCQPKGKRLKALLHHARPK
jgi:hypothetical protein